MRNIKQNAFLFIRIKNLNAQNKCQIYFDNSIITKLEEQKLNKKLKKFIDKLLFINKFFWKKQNIEISDLLFFEIISPGKSKFKISKDIKEEINKKVENFHWKNIENITTLIEELFWTIFNYFHKKFHEKLTEEKITKYYEKRMSDYPLTNKIQLLKEAILNKKEQIINGKANNNNPYHNVFIGSLTLSFTIKYLSDIINNLKVQKEIKNEKTILNKILFHIILLIRKKLNDNILKKNLFSIISALYKNEKSKKILKVENDSVDQELIGSFYYGLEVYDEKNNKLGKHPVIIITTDNKEDIRERLKIMHEDIREIESKNDSKRIKKNFGNILTNNLFICIDDQTFKKTIFFTDKTGKLKSY